MRNEGNMPIPRKINATPNLLLPQVWGRLGGGCESYSNLFQHSQPHPTPPRHCAQAQSWGGKSPNRASYDSQGHRPWIRVHSNYQTLKGRNNCFNGNNSQNCITPRWGFSFIHPSNTRSDAPGCRISPFFQGLVLCLLLSFFLYHPALVYAQDVSPYKKMLDEPVEFLGPDSQSSHPSELKEIRIGYFAPNKDEHPASRMMWWGSLLAVEQANKAGGYEGLPFRLIQRWASDPWGAGSKEMIRLVYEDRVWAVIGSIGGDSTHIAQQVATKAHLPLISPLSSDPSLTHVRVPWIFRLAPSDTKQARWLVQKMQEAEIKKVGMITAASHDGRTFADEMTKQLRGANLPPKFHFTIDSVADTKHLMKRIQTFEPEGVVVYADSNFLPRIMKQNKTDSIVWFTPWTPGHPVSKGVIAYKPAIQKIEPFVETFKERYGHEPDACAGYGYDAVQMVIRAIRQAGLSRNGVREALQSMDSFDGVMGPVRWDHGGGNVAAGVVVQEAQ